MACRPGTRVVERRHEGGQGRMVGVRRMWCADRAARGDVRGVTCRCGGCASPRLDLGRGRGRPAALLLWRAMRSGATWARLVRILVVGACLGVAAVAHASPEQPHVLILLPGQPGSPGAAAIA